MSDKMMEEAFFLPVSVEDLDVVDSDNMSLFDCNEDWIAEYAAHAINQHDTLTNRVKVLENGLKQLALSESVAVRNHVNKLLEADNG